MSDLQPERELLPRYHISSNKLGHAEALAAFQHVMQHIFTCTKLPGGLDDVRLQGWHLGSVILSAATTPAMHYARPVELVQSSGIDLILLNLYLSGGFDGQGGRHAMTARPGDICVFDLGQILAGETMPSHVINLVMPRSMLAPLMDDPSAVHGLVLPASHPATSLLALYLQNLVAKAPEIDITQAGHVSRATLALVSQVIAGAAGHRTGAPGRIINSPFRDILNYIDTHLSDSGLQPETLMREFGVSRAKLYRQFEDIGGVANYIRRRRLAAAALYLTSSAHKDWRISQIAFACGFPNEENFGRNFKQQFGLTPREARERAIEMLAAKAWLGPDIPEPQDALSWMKTLRLQTYGIGHKV
jgi:AraC-like DNA-binding protein